MKPGTGNGMLYKRKNRKGEELPTWWIKYYLPGRRAPKRESTGTDNDEAARQFLHARLAETGPIRAERLAREDITVGRLLDLLEADYEDQGQPLPMGHVAAWRALLGAVPALDVRRDQLDMIARRWRKSGITWEGRDTKRVRPIGTATCNRLMATLRRAFSLGKEKLGLVTALTFPHFAETARHKAIPPADFYAILAQVRREVVRWVFELAYLNGVRKGQLTRTELANVNSTEWILTWRGDQTKTGKRTGVPHVVPVVGRSREIVQQAWAQRRPDCCYLFHEDGKPLGQLRSEWNRACRKAGFPVGRKAGGYVIHGTRHSALSNMTAAGIPAPVAMSISGHRTTSVFLRYNVIMPETQRAALEQMEAHVQATTTKSKVTPMRQVAS